MILATRQTNLGLPDRRADTMGEMRRSERLDRFVWYYGRSTP